MTDVERFRGELTELLERELPREVGEVPPATAEYWGGRNPELPHPMSRRYCEVMAARGLTAPTWPKEYGGGGLDQAQAKVLLTELRRLGLPVPLVGFGLSMIGPTLLQFGTEAQKREHLRPLYSPEAGVVRQRLESTWAWARSSACAEHGKRSRLCGREAAGSTGSPGTGRAEAPRRAKLHMLHQPRYAHPYYWSAFIPAGDWRPLDRNTLRPQR